MNDEQIKQYAINAIKLVQSKFDGLGSAYIGGSYANNYAIPTSDIDLYLFFDNHLENEQYDEIERLNDEIKCNIDIDFIAIDIQKIKKIGLPSLGQYFLHIWGKDLSNIIPKPNLQYEIYRGMHGGYMRMELSRKEKPYTFPLDYPDMNQELKGYDWRVLRSNNGEVKSIKEIVVLTGWMCTGLVNWIGKKIVPTKKHCPIMFKELFPGEVSEAFSEITDYCRNTFHYLIPENEKDFKKLLSLMPKVLMIENFFLEKYQDFLIEYLSSKNPIQVNTSIIRLGNVIYPNNKSLEALNSIKPANEKQEKNLKKSLETLNKFKL